MSDIVGGLGERLLRDSLLRHVRLALDELGWFEESTDHRPVQLIDTPFDWDVPVEPNLIAISFEVTQAEEAELGNERFIQSTDDVTLVVYAESESLGVELSGDIMAILTGNLPAIGRDRPTFSILDLQQPTPPSVGYARVDGATMNRIPTSVKRSWRAFWFEITFTVIRHYTG